MDRVGEREPHLLCFARRGGAFLGFRDPLSARDFSCEAAPAPRARAREGSDRTLTAVDLRLLHAHATRRSVRSSSRATSRGFRLPTTRASRLQPWRVAKGPARPPLLHLRAHVGHRYAPFVRCPRNRIEPTARSRGGRARMRSCEPRFDQRTHPRVATRKRSRSVPRIETRWHRHCLGERRHIASASSGSTHFGAVHAQQPSRSPRRFHPPHR